MRFLLAIVLFGLAPALQAQDWQALEPIRLAAAEHVRAQVGADATVESGALDSRLRLASCTLPLSLSTFSGNASASTIAVRCAAPEWLVYVPVRVSRSQDVLVLSRPLARGELITAEVLQLQRREGLANGVAAYSEIEQVLGKSPIRPLAAGAVLTAEVLTAPRLVQRGQQVVLIGRAGAVEVRSSGRAMADATAGARVRIQNLTSGLMVEGTVLPTGVVEVGL